ncbi:MAG: AtzH-like domain-containing protein [Pseudonocardiaceae bacterium]|nr:AtzH-like domain-containing protein [Pseudonocardiaceae bacterium]
MTPIPAVATSVPECIDQVAVNRPAIVADVRAAFERYEAALVAGDVATLNELFWDSPSSLRFGVTDRQRGATEIHNWRRRHSGVPAGRRLRDTDVLTVDRHTAVVTTLFDYPHRPNEGRQTQVWVRFPEGWRIVSAHLSEVPAS